MGHTNTLEQCTVTTGIDTTRSWSRAETQLSEYSNRLALKHGCCATLLGGGAFLVSVVEVNQPEQVPRGPCSLK